MADTDTRPIWLGPTTPTPRHAEHPRTRHRPARARRIGVRRNRYSTLSASLIAFSAIAAVAACTSPGAQPQGPPPTGVVVANVDGDTLRIRLGGVDEAVRLIGLDTPEITHRGEPGDCYGREAAERTAGLAPPGSVVAVYLDAEARDRYRRLLAYVVVDDGLLNLALVRDGYARTLDIAPNSLLRRVLSGAERTARRDGRGLWAACDPG